MWVFPVIFIYTVHVQTPEGTLLLTANCVMLASMKMGIYKLTI